MSRRKEQKNNSAGFKLSPVILNLFSIFCLLLLNAVGTTGAYFSDRETAKVNYTAATLSFNITSTENFNPALTPTQPSRREIFLHNSGTSEFSYQVRSLNIAGDPNFCEQILIEVKLAEQILYSGFLSDLSVEDISLTSGETADWEWISMLATNNQQFQNLNCNFDLEFLAWQTDFSDFSFGFSDQEIISNTITSGTWTATSLGIVINEFLPNPFGVDEATMPGGEWVELYNLSTAPVEVAGWVLYDDDNWHELFITAGNTNTGGTIVPAGGFLVVYRNGDGDFSMDNEDNDTVRLYDDEIGDDGNLIDSHYYYGRDFRYLTPTPGTTNIDDARGVFGKNVPENKSYARIPDGTGDWVDPIPTPGEPNRLEDTESTLLRSEDSRSFGGQAENMESEAPSNDWGTKSPDDTGEVGSGDLVASGGPMSSEVSVDDDVPISSEVPVDDGAAVEGGGLISEG